MVCNGKPVREWQSREDSSSPAAALESIILAGVIDDAHEEHDIVTRNVPSVFTQALVPKTKSGDEPAMTKIKGALVSALINLNPELRGPRVVCEKTRKVLCVHEQ
jgi:hypothetical protein